MSADIARSFDHSPQSPVFSTTTLSFSFNGFLVFAALTAVRPIFRRKISLHRIVGTFVPIAVTNPEYKIVNII